MKAGSSRGQNSEGYSGDILLVPPGVHVPEPGTIWAFALIAGALGVRRLRSAGRS